MCHVPMPCSTEPFQLRLRWPFYARLAALIFAESDPKTYIEYEMMIDTSRGSDAALTERWSNVGKWEALAALDIAVLALHATGGIRARSGVRCLRGDGGHEGEDGEEDATHSF
ncbi:hypothetical protein CPAR01_09070 [Colletotrichum paranaense]|uniref:Uncharacterized protein n=1 Tax=Colletotrichum paranaense TaxID=1914294 RepID=A0ABQ9SGZ9_9PEZI|nr:uncharacterized protein CPAR01_09070 [Colletotrichum paranaense]KAK1535528.1 hypothetical protein CPAR01_09070 [Colletotrichum paranaense]